MIQQAVEVATGNIRISVCHLYHLRMYTAERFTSRGKRQETNLELW